MARLSLPRTFARQQFNNDIIPNSPRRTRVKKILAIFASFAFIFSVAACNLSTTTITTTSASTSQSTSTGTITTTSTSTDTTTTTTQKTFNTATAQVTYDGAYCDDLELDEVFVEDLLDSLTLAEKIGQMMQAERNGASLNDVRNYNLGSILSGGGSSPSTNLAYNWYLMVKDFLNASMQSSSGIPLMYGVDAVHGHNNVFGATIFPHNIGLGAANDPDLMYKIGLVTAREVRVTGIQYTFAPAVSLVQNIAWGRTYESMSESADIVSELVSPYIEGLQSYCVAGSAKHFVADGGTTNGSDQGNANLTEAQIRALHLKPYYDAIESGVHTIMISYSSIQGQKMHQSEYWINDVLKTEMGFEGFVISDYNAIQQLQGTYYDKLVTAINAGIDMLMEPFDWKDAITQITTAVQNGDIPMARIDDAVRRILSVKYQIGLFHEDFKNETTGEYYRLTYDDYFYTAENRAVAREAVRKSLVLLKNEGNALPLDKAGTYAVLGEGAKNIGLQSGGWTIGWQGEDKRSLTSGVTIFNGLRNAAASKGGSVIDSVTDADTVIIVFSEKPYAEYYGDNSNPTLTGSTAHAGNVALLDQALEARVAGKKVIGLLLSGRPILLGNYLDYFDAFIACWLPGSEAGNGIADVMFGDYNFTGKLPVTWPKTALGIGMNSNSTVYNPAVVLFPFGFGLSYEEELHG
jgi:beta-glucosidase